MHIRSNLEGRSEDQHRAMLAAVRALYRQASVLAEHTVADSWDGGEIEYAHWLMDSLQACVWEVENRADQGQKRLPGF